MSEAEVATYLHPVASRGPLVAIKGSAQRRPASTNHPVATDCEPSLCHWTRPSGSIKLAIGGQNQSEIMRHEGGSGEQ